MAEKRSVPPAARFCAALTTIWLPTPRSAANRNGKRLCRCFAHRTNLCKSDKKSRLDAVSVWMPEFSASKGQRFAPPAASKAVPFWVLPFFILYTILRGAAREDSNSCKGDRRLRRGGKASGCPTVKIAFSAIIYSGSPFAGASVVAAARQGRGRRGKAPPKGRSPMRVPQPGQCPLPYVPAGKKVPAGLF